MVTAAELVLTIAIALGVLVPNAHTTASGYGMCKNNVALLIIYVRTISHDSQLFSHNINRSGDWS